MSQRRKSAITFPYIILMSSHSNTDPSQSILTHEIWQAVPEVMQLLLGNRIVITGPVYLGFRGRFGSQAANSLIWAGIASGICLRACTSHSVFPLCTEHRRFSPPGFGVSHCPVLESWTVSFLGVMDSQFSKGLCFLSSCQVMLSLVLLMSSSQLLQIFSYSYNGVSRCERWCHEAGS